MSNIDSTEKIARTLNKIADEFEYMASTEYDVDRLNKIAHMLSAINGLSILKSMTQNNFYKEAGNDLGYETALEKIAKLKPISRLEAFVRIMEKSLKIPQTPHKELRTKLEGFLKKINKQPRSVSSNDMKAFMEEHLKDRGIKKELASKYVEAMPKYKYIGNTRSTLPRTLSGQIDTIYRAFLGLDKGKRGYWENLKKVYGKQGLLAKILAPTLPVATFGGLGWSIYHFAKKPKSRLERIRRSLGIG